jgi:hypothetical protein
LVVSYNCDLKPSHDFLDKLFHIFIMILVWRSPP